MPAIKTESHFWEKVDKTPGHGPQGECWLWTGRCDVYGYGHTRICSRLDRERDEARTHRISYVLAYGAIPEGLQVLHTCDNPPCVNPAHLFLGTHADNMRDRSRKGRGNHPFGSRNGSVRLTKEQVEEIRRRYAEGGIYQYEIAAQYGIAQTTVSAIVRREIWR